MRKRFLIKKRKLVGQARRTPIHETWPLSQSPSGEHGIENNNAEKNCRLHASDLFTLFTADIIMQDVIFTR